MVGRLQREAAPLKKAEEEATKAWNIVDKKMSDLGGRLNETNRAANDIVKKNEREANKLDEIKVCLWECLKCLRILHVCGRILHQPIL